MVLEEARAKLGQDNDALTSTRGRQEGRVGLQGSVLELHESKLQGSPPRAGKGGGLAEQSISPL